MHRRLRLAALPLLGMAAWPLHAATQRFDRAFDAAVDAAREAMMASPDDALADARRAEAIARGLRIERNRALAGATALWLEGEATSRLNAPAQALVPLAAALETVARIEPANPLHGDLLLSRGAARSALGQTPQALADFQHAHAIFHHAGETRGQAKALQSIAGIYHDAGDDAHALRYSAQVAELAAGDPPIALAANNNVGEALKALGRYPAAVTRYQAALALARRAGSPLLEVRILTNLASAQLLGGKAEAATATVRRALALSERGEAAEERPFVWGMLAQIEATRGHWGEAGELLGRTFAGIDLDRSTLGYRDFHKSAAAVYGKLGRYDLAYQHLAAFKRLDDGARALAASTNAALAAARFDFTAQDLRITRLKTDQLRAAAHARSVIFSVALAAAIVTLLLLLWRGLSLRRSRNEVRAANALLTESNRSLEQALTVKTEFLATTSHEIRTPLNGILGMTQVLLADPRTEAHTREKIELVHGAGETMKALVDDILDLSKMETGNLAVAAAPLDLRRLLRATGAFWQGQADAKGVALRFDVAGAPPLIVGDEGRLRQIVFNLLSNALKFTPAGEVSLVAHVVAEGERERLRIAVGDTGIGIPADQLERIFDKFTQVDGSTARRFGGTGLGLAICRNLARAMGGDIMVASREGEGSTFTLEVPLLRSDGAALPADAAAPAGTLAEAALLLVEPNALTQRILAKALRPAVARFAAVPGLAAASGALAEGPCDLLLVQAEAAAGEADGTNALLALAAAAKAHGAQVALLHPADTLLDLAALAHAGVMTVARPIAGPALVAQLAAGFATASQSSVYPADSRRTG